MGNGDSKLRFKTHIFRLFESTNIPHDDSYYWVEFWTQPDSVYDVFTLLSSSDIRKTRDGNLDNLETLIKVVYSRLKELRYHKSFPNNELAPSKELLNCVRILTRILPYIYEKDNDRIENWEKRIFWESGDESSPIGPDLIDIALELLFIEGFTVPKQNGDSSSSSPLLIWEPGVGSNTIHNATHELHSNRVEILRFLLTLVSDCLYQNLSDIAVIGSNYLTYIVTKPDKRLAMTILCSLLNTSLKYSPGGKVPYDHILIADRNRQLVIYSLQLLVILLIYPVPEKNDNNNNRYRYFFSKIRHPKDFQFIIDNLLKLISQPILASSSLLPGSHSEIHWISELIMLFWELTQCNRKFREYLLSSSSCTDFMIFFLAYIQEKYYDVSKRELVRLCAYILLYLSSDVTFVKLLRYKVEVRGDNDNDTNGNLRRKYISSKSKMSIFNGTYADYLISQLLIPLLNGNGNDNMFDFLAPTFLEIIYNISPYVMNISYSSSSNLVQLFSNLLSINNNIATPTKEFLIINILKSFSNMIHYNFRSNKNLLFVMLKNESKFRLLAGTDEVEQQTPEGVENTVEKSASKSKGKQPATLSPPNSTSSLPNQEIWILIDPLLMILDNLQKLIPYSQHIINSERQTTDSNFHSDTKVQPHIIIESIGNISSLPDVNLDPNEPDDNKFEPIKFSWNARSLGWYESIIWGSIFQNESQVVSSAINEVATNLVLPKIGSVGVWNGTYIKLFKLQETARLGPSLLRPKGAVDAVAESVMQQFGKLTH